MEFRCTYFLPCPTRPWQTGFLPPRPPHPVPLPSELIHMHSELHTYESPAWNNLFFTLDLTDCCSCSGSLLKLFLSVDNSLSRAYHWHRKTYSANRERKTQIPTLAQHILEMNLNKSAPIFVSLTILKIYFSKFLLYQPSVAMNLIFFLFLSYSGTIILLYGKLLSFPSIEIYFHSSCLPLPSTHFLFSVCNHFQSPWHSNQAESQVSGS